MPAPKPRTPRRLPEALRRRLEVATAMAWEALVETHSAHALQFIALLAHRLAFDEAVDRYLQEVGASQALSGAVRTRVLVALEDAEQESESRPTLQLQTRQEDEEEVAGWRRFRPDVVMRGVKQRVREAEETDRWVLLAIARAEEGIISTHVDNAITFVALLEDHMPLDRAVEEYVDTMNILGARGQAIIQRTMARLAEVRLPGGPTAPRPTTKPADRPRAARRKGS